MHQQVKNILNTFSKIRAAVVGDISLDLYYFLADSSTEISVETGLQTQAVKQVRHEAGGAANAAVNLMRLGALSADLYGVTGADANAAVLRGILEREHVGTGTLCVQDSDWQTNVYHKIYQNAQELPRLDIGCANSISEQSAETLLSTLSRKAGEYGVIVINQQLTNGIHSQEFQQKLLRIIKQHPGLWICDCRTLNDIYSGTLRKLNDAEALELCQSGGGTGSRRTDQAARRLSKRWQQPVVITRGQNGVLVCDDDAVHRIPGVHLIQETDAVGAGDAFLAAFALTLAAGHSLKDAALTGNLAASVSVTKLRKTGHPTPEEVLKISRNTDYRYNPDLAADPRTAEMIPGTDIEIVTLRRDTGLPKVMIFDHDGTISTLRQGWEDIMFQMMIQEVFGDALPDIPHGEYERVCAQIRRFIRDTSGVQTIVQMQAMQRFITSAGYIDASQIKNPFEYKAVYNAMLMDTVGKRTRLFREGHLGTEDLTIKGAVGFLRKMHEAKVTLYLASGTDQDDVREEAHLLGYGGLFNGGIFGSLGNAAEDPKRIVLEKIMTKTNSASDCAVFGDGPVEMREARKRGCAAVGVVSDEVRRFGINPDKRERLILGGAGFLIPDFSWADELALAIGWSHS